MSRRNLRKGFGPAIAVIVFAGPILSLPVRAETTLRVASVQMEVSNEIEKNLARIEQGIRDAKKDNARVVLFPETALSGFDEDTIESLDWSKLDRAMERIAGAADENDLYVIYGTATRSAERKPYNTAMVIGPDGEEVFRYHKMVPEGWFEPGNRLALFHIDGVTSTLIVCHDNRYPELVRIPAIRGAQICFYISYEINPLAGSLAKMENYRSQLIGRASENGIFVLQSNGIGGVPGSEDDRIVLGYSRFIRPNGQVIAEAPGMTDTMLVEDIDLAEAKRGNAKNSLGIRLLSDWWKEGLAKLPEEKARPEDAQLADLGDSATKLRLGLMRGVPVKWDVETNFNVFLEQLEAASEKNIDIFITPECWLDGYASPDEASTPEKLRTIAQDLESSPILKRVSEEASKRNMYICFGFTSLEDGEIYNAAGLWGRDGKRIGVYHKTHLQTHDLQYSFGEELPVWPTEYGPMGIMICADRRWPETARTLRVKGAKLILNPTYGMCHAENEMWMRTRGYENQCFIAFTHPKVGLVVGPKGKIEGKEENEAPGVLICDIDLSEAKDNNHIQDRRPELYRALAEIEKE